MTSVAVQQQLAYDRPNCGTLLADCEVPDGEMAPAERLLQPRADVVRAVEYAVCAIEIVDSRITGWDIRATDSIADKASCGMYLLGTRPHRITEVDRTLCGMVSRLRNEALR